MNINLVIVLIDISNFVISGGILLYQGVFCYIRGYFVISGGILFKMLALRINEIVSCLSSEVLKG